MRSKQVESVSTLLDLIADPDTSPNTIEVLKPDLASASALAEKLSELKEVAKVRTLESFVPTDQDEKLALIDDASFFFENTLTPAQVAPAPTPAETLEAINKTAADLSGAAKGLDSPAATQARRLADALTALAKAPEAQRDEAERILVTPLMTTLREVRDLLTAEHVTIDTLPPSLRSAWVAADGEVRVEVAPSGDGNDNAVLRRFVEAVRKVAPQASGGPVFIVEAAATIVRAFLEAALWSVASIALILFVTLRRWVDVALTLVPLMVAIVVTLEICVVDRARTQLRQHHRLAAVARRRRRVQNLLRHGVEGGGDELSPVEPDPRGLLQRLRHRHRLRQPVVLAPSGHLEHGQADGALAGNDALRRRPVPARPPGDAAEESFGLTVCRAAHEKDE